MVSCFRGTDFFLQLTAGQATPPVLDFGLGIGIAIEIGIGIGISIAIETLDRVHL
jgi:hypothetical protein